jgi:hypothetical protein
MTSAWKQFTIATALFGKTQRALLSLFFTKPTESFYLREIVRTAEIGLGAAQRELARWTEAGLLIRTQRGNQVRYRANPLSPVFAELRSLATKTIGIVDALRHSLGSVSDRIVVAFIHGLLTCRLEQSDIDVDLVVIGDVGSRELAVALQSARSKIGRDLNPTVFTPRDYRTKLRAKQHFVKSLGKSPKEFLIGDDAEFQRLGTSGIDS